MPKEDNPADSELLDKDNRQDLRNFTEVPEDFFTELYYEIGNEDEVLKIVDSVKHKHPVYYVFTDFLIDRDY